MSSSPPLAWNLGGMFFDAWLRLNHNNSLTITQHPVETGASITDHSYRNPNRFSFEIGMTDTVEAPAFPGSATRSINAYNTLVALQQTRQLLTLVTKYGSYSNVLIEAIDVPDDFQTKYSLRATITLLEVILVSTQVTASNANPQAVNQTNRGQVPAQTITERVTEGLVRAGITSITSLLLGSVSGGG